MDLMPVLDRAKCNGCGLCVSVCYCGAFVMVDNQVTIVASKLCGWCTQCRTGRYNLCPNVKFLGTPPVEGVFQEYYLFHFKKK